MDAFNLIGDLASLGVSLLGVLVVVLLPAFFLSSPAWLIGRIAAPNSPQLKKVRSNGVYWGTWVIFGGIPATIGILGGPFAGTSHLIPTPWAIAFGITGLIFLNVNAYIIGYKQGLASKAKREIRKNLRNYVSRPDTSCANVDLLNENHPAIASDHGDITTATTPLPVAEALHPHGNDVPTREIATLDAAPQNNDEYPTARPVGY